MRRPARCLARNSREAPETKPSATTSGREELADGEAGFASSRAGPEPKIPRWSAERRASPLRREAPRDSAFTRVFVAPTARWRASSTRYGACGPASSARERVPRKHPSACRRSASLGFRDEGNRYASGDW